MEELIKQIRTDLYGLSMVIASAIPQKHSEKKSAELLLADTLALLNSLEQKAKEPKQ